MNTPKGPAPMPILFEPLPATSPAPAAAPVVRTPLPPRVETRRWKDRDVDAYTVDRGAAHGFILSNIYLDGELLFSRRVPYVPNAAVEEVAALMNRHHDALLQDLASGALDADLQAVLGAAAPARGAPPAVVLPPPTPDPLPTRSFTYVYRAGSAHSDELPGQVSRPAAPAPPPAPAQRPAPSPPRVANTAGVIPPAPASLPPRMDPAAVAPHLRVVLQKPADLLPMLFSTSSGLGIRVRGATTQPLGASVDVALWFKGRPLRQFLVRGVLAARRPASGAESLDDLAITVPSSERTALDLAIEFARGILDPTVDRMSPRIRCQVPARVVTAQGQEMPAVVMNLSEGGAMLGRMPPLMSGTRLTLHLERPGHPPLALPSDVRWFRADGLPLVGIQFVHGTQSRQRVEQVVAGLMAAAGGV